VLPTDPGVDYTVGEAFSALANNMLLVITWSFGSFVGLAVATVGFTRRRDLPSRGVLSALLLVWPIAFFFFWGAYASVMLWDITKYVGPFYYLPMALVMALAIGVGIMRLTRHRRGRIVALTALLALVSLITLIPAIHTNEHRTAQRRVIDDLVHARLDHAGRSILFLPDIDGAYLQNPFSFLRNPPSYDGRVLYAVHGSNHEFDVLDDHPGRTPYLLSIPSGYNPDVPAAKIRASINRVSRVRGSSLDFRVTASPTLAKFKPLARMIMGDKLVYIPMQRVAGGGAVARFTIARTAQGTRVTSPDDPSLHTSTRVPNDALHVSVVVPKENYGVMPVDNRDFAFRARGSDLDLLLPGSHSMDKLGGSLRLQFAITPGQSENE
jgi:hypothetical protein